MRRIRIFDTTLRDGEQSPGIALDVGEAEMEAFWRSFLRSLVERGLDGVQLVVSDAHAGLKKAIAQVLGCSLSATKSLIHRGRETLKEKLKPYLRSGIWRDPR